MKKKVITFSMLALIATSGLTTSCSKDNVTSHVERKQEKDPQNLGKKGEPGDKGEKGDKGESGKGTTVVSSEWIYLDRNSSRTNSKRKY